MKRLFLAALILLLVYCRATAAAYDTIPFSYNDFSEDVHTHDGKGYLRQGQLIISSSTVRNLSFDGPLATIKTKDYGWLYVRRDGTTRRTVFYDSFADRFVEGLARYTTGSVSRFDPNGKIGFINRHGDIVIPAQFQWVFPFEKGYSVVCNGCHQVPEGEYHMLVGGQWGCIDKKGNIVIPAKYSEHEIYSQVSGLPSLTTKWTPNFKGGTIGLEIKNTGNTPLQFEPTPITRFIPTASYEHDHDLEPYGPEGSPNSVAPVFTFVGSTFKDNRGSAENGGFDKPIVVQPNETKTITIPLGLSPAELTTQCDYIFIWLYFNGAKIYDLQMKRDDKGVWKEG